MKNSNLDRRSRYSLLAIRSAMFELLETEPLDKITITEICAKADINRGTFYKYYRDVYDLFEQTENDFIEEIHTLFSATKAVGSEIPDVFANIFRILSENKQFVRIARNREFTERFSKKLMVFVIPQINSLIRGADPAASEEEILFRSDYIIGGCTRGVAAWIAGNMEIPAERMERYLTEFIKKSLQNEN